MANRKKRKNKSSAALKDLVTVAFAEDMDLANQYKELLNDNDIPAAIKTRPNSDVSYQGIAVMVPEEYLDEAHILIEDQNSMGDFYDMAFGDEEFDDTEQGYYDPDDEF